MSADHTWALDTARAFDAVAGEYDLTNTANPILRDMSWIWPDDLFYLVSSTRTITSS